MAEPAKNHLNVYIKCDGEKCFVDPGDIDVEDQKKIRLHNKTGGRVAVVFSEKSLLPDSQFKIENDKHKDLGVNKVLRGIYPFAVYCEITGNFATASSMPIIIVRR